MKPELWSPAVEVPAGALESSRRAVFGELAERQTALHAAVDICAVGLGAAALAASVTPVGGYDFAIFRAAGSAVLHGQSPYPAATAVVNNNAFVYPPAAAWLFAPFSAIAAAAGNTVFLILSAVCLAWACRLLLGHHRVAEHLLILTSAVALRGLEEGTVNGLLMVAVAAAWATRRSGRSTAYLAAAGIVKPFIAVVLAGPAVAGRWRAAGLACGVAAVVIALGFATGPESVVGYLGLLRHATAQEAPTSLSTVRALEQAGLSPTGAQLVAAALAGGFLVAVWRASARDARTTLSAGIVAAVALSPVVWSHYDVLLFAPLAILGAPRLAYAALWLAGWVITPTVAWHLPEALHRLSGAAPPWAVAQIALVLCAALTLRRASGQCATYAGASM